MTYWFSVKQWQSIEAFGYSDAEITAGEVVDKYEEILIHEDRAHLSWDLLFLKMS
jgi:hypothetical protein